jgi:hypothetical protein
VLARNDPTGKENITTSRDKSSEIHIDDETDMAKIHGKKVIATDPGQFDLVYCVDSDERDQVKLPLHSEYSTNRHACQETS